MIANPIAGPDRSIATPDADVDVEAERQLPEQGLLIRVRQGAIPRVGDS